MEKESVFDGTMGNSGNYTIDLEPNTACHFTATNNMPNYTDLAGKSKEFIMGVYFMHNTQLVEDTRRGEEHMPFEILVDNKMPMYPRVW